MLMHTWSDVLEFLWYLWIIGIAKFDCIMSWQTQVYRKQFH